MQIFITYTKMGHKYCIKNNSHTSEPDEFFNLIWLIRIKDKNDRKTSEPNEFFNLIWLIRIIGEIDRQTSTIKTEMILTYQDLFFTITLVPF